MAQTCVVDTECGRITLVLRPDVAPQTVAHFCKLAPLFDGTCFYRSDFVIQCGLQTPAGAAVPNPLKPIAVNETRDARTTFATNARGTCAFGHWDVPDAGSSDWFINLKANPHLDDAYGGYCVFAEIRPDDAASFATVDAIAAAVLAGRKPAIRCLLVE